MPWEKSYNESDVLDRAMQAFWARGYEATSVSDLVRATGINRGSLYASYPNKRAVFIAALKHYDRHHRADFLAALAATHGPRDAILAVFESASRAANGCLLVNTSLELSPHDPEIRGLIARSFGEVEAFFRDRITEAQAEGTIGAGIDPEATAKALLGLFLGLRVMTRADLDPTTLKTITSQARMMLG